MAQSDGSHKLQSAAAISQRVCLRRVHGEEAQDSDHLERFLGEWRRIHQLGVSAKLFRLAQSVHDSANSGRIDDRHPFQIEDEADMAGGQGGLNRAVEMIDGLPAFEGPLYLQYASIPALPDIEIHRTSVVWSKFSLHREGQLLASIYPQNHPASPRQAELC